MKASKGENRIFLTLAKFYIPIFYFFNLNHVFPPKSLIQSHSGAWSKLNVLQGHRVFNGELTMKLHLASSKSSRDLNMWSCGLISLPDENSKDNPSPTVYVQSFPHMTRAVRALQAPSAHVMTDTGDSSQGQYLLVTLDKILVKLSEFTLQIHPIGITIIVGSH